MTTSSISNPVVPLLGWWQLTSGYRGFEADGTSYTRATARGVALRVQEAQLSEPFFERQEAWEKHYMGYLQVMRDGGQWRMWYSTAGTAEGSMIGYAESDDGWTWRRPRLNRIDWNGSTDNNLCMSGLGTHGLSVFIDPTAGPEERYKAVGLGGWFRDRDGKDLGAVEGHRRLIEQNRRLAQNPAAEQDVFCGAAMFGWTSPDGLGWMRIEKPVLDAYCDTHNVATYDEQRRRYVAYVRMGGMRGRSVGRVEFDDFRAWPKPTLNFSADDQDPPTDSIYGPAYCRYPTDPGIHLLFPHVYHHDTDHVDIQLATSPEGLVWHRPERKALVRPPGGFSSLYPGLSLIAEGDKFMLPVCVVGAYHNEGYAHLERAEPRVDYRWATWKRDRLAGIEAAGEGEFTTRHLRLSGQPLRVNCQTRPGGSVRVELVPNLPWPPQQGEGEPGYRAQECLPICGDQLDARVQWESGLDLSRFAGRNVVLRFVLDRATVFAVTT